MRENKVKAKLNRGEVAVVLSGQMTPDIVDWLGPLGFDGVWIEGEHGPVDYKDIPDLTRAADIWGMTSVVRVNQNVPGVIYRTLDVGAQGIVVPHVNTRDEAQEVVKAGKFAPLGERGMFGSRQSYGVDNYFAEANDQSLLVVLIEDIVAVHNLDEILSVDHIDIFFVAPSDLATSMGHIGDLQHPEVQKTIDDALNRIQAAGRTAGTLAVNNTAATYAAAGVRFLLTPTGPWLAAGAAEFISRTGG
jgi:4-hydroxy-2-oxoheptanedioate aldolase